MQEKKLLPFSFYSLPFFFLAITGLLDSIYLAVSHYRGYIDFTYSSFCALSNAINCDTVSQSPWSILFGVPVAHWGIFAYSIVAILVVPAIKNTPIRRNLWYVLFFLSALYSLAGMYFGYISAVKIHAYCIMCLLSYGINFGLLFSSWIILRRFSIGPYISGLRQGFATLWSKRFFSATIVLIFILFTCEIIFLPRYWLYELPPLSEQIATGITTDNHPWIGSPHPSLVIEEFTDYQCFKCSQMHLLLRRLINQYPDKIQLVHHHYPLDDKFNPFLVKTPAHNGSGQMALLAIAAGQQNKFWQSNDFLYSIAREKLKEFNIIKFANKLGIDANKLKQDMYAQDTLKLLEEDIREGLRNKMLGTPSFIINGKVYQGTIPQNVFEKLLL